MNLWQNYIRPKNLSEAMDAFANAPRPLAPIAGGTDLLLDLEQGRHSPVQTLIDVTSVAEMTRLETIGDELFIGASVPVNRIALDPLTVAHAQALVEACNLIAGPQVRNVATLGGNVAHALPAADGTIALLALDAQAEIASVPDAGRVAAERRTETRRIPFRELFLGPGKSSLKHGEELIVGFYIPICKSLKVSETFRVSSCFKRIMRPQGVALPILNCAVWLEREKDAIKDIRIAIGPGGGTPFRAAQAEDVLRGKSLDEETFESALKALLAEAKFRTSARRASADYRQHLVVTLFKETFKSAWERA
ncbi:MAG: FAD binding domain-containing protein [Anaerolineales bacterium]|nr:FAD binding domain-containing protein [Anaerolineales bacterium]NUQ84862.1 FAD binding domain-containing protein [Anaerolineales bacterium]